MVEKNIPPVQFSAIFFEMENGDVAITLEKFPRARERGGEMIVCVCGLIGSGKSTFCKEQEGIISDYDLIGDKNRQIKFTLIQDAKGKTVYHITCYPTPKEREAFEGKNVRYIWINTSWRQCYDNIFKRKRKRDMQNIEAVLSSNLDYLKKFERTNIPFEIIDIFRTDEKW